MRASLKCWKSRSACQSCAPTLTLRRRFAPRTTIFCLFVCFSLGFLLLLLFLATSYWFSWDVYVATWGFGEAWCEGNIISAHDLARFQRQTAAGFHLLPSSSETECHLVEFGASCSRWRLLYLFMVRRRADSSHRRVYHCLKGFTWPSLFKLCSVNS